MKFAIEVFPDEHFNWSFRVCQELGSLIYEFDGRGFIRAEEAKEAAEEWCIRYEQLGRQQQQYFFEVNNGRPVKFDPSVIVNKE